MKKMLTTLTSHIPNQE